MATKKTSKKNTTANKASPKRTNKRAKAKAPEAIVVEESKGIYTITSVEENNNDTYAKLPEETPPPANIEYKQDNSDLIQENASYNNVMLPAKEKDNSVTYIVAGLVLVILMWAIFA